MLPIWMYWNNSQHEMPAAASLYVDSVLRHYDDVRLLDDDGLRELGGMRWLI